MFDDAVVKILNIFDNNFSNDIIEIILIYYVENNVIRVSDEFFYFINRINDLMFLFISRLLYNEIVSLFCLIFFITNCLYNKFT